MVKYRSLNDKGKDAPKKASYPGIKYRPIEEVTKTYQPKNPTIRSFEEELVESFGLDMEWEKKQEAREKAAKLPKLDMEAIRNKSGNYDPEAGYRTKTEISESNKQAHIDAGLQEPEKKEKSVRFPFLNSASQDGKPRATLGTAGKPEPQRASLQAGGKTVYNQNQAVTNTQGNQLMTDGNMKSNTPREKDNDIRFRKDRAESLVRGIKDIPRNLGAGVVQALDTGAEFFTGGQHNNSYKARTREDWEKANTPFKTYDEYLANIDKLNEGVAEQKGTVERIASKVTEETTFVEKAIRGAALNLPSSFLTAGLGGLGAGVAQGLTKNKIIIEGARNLPLFSSGLNGGLETADQIGLTGAKKYSYGIASGIIETATERMSMLGFEGQLMGKATKGAVGGFGETLRGLIEEPLTEGLNSVAQQVLTGAYTSMEDFELDMEEIQLSMASAFIMSGVNVSGTFRNGMKYKTIGMEDGMVLVETQDGRVEPMSPEIVAKHQFEMTRPEYEEVKKAYRKQNMAEMFEQYSNDEVETNNEATIPTQEPTRSQETVEPETKVSTLKEVKPVTEPLNEAETVRTNKDFVDVAEKIFKKNEETEEYYFEDWGVRFDDKAYEIGETIPDSKDNTGREDERDFPEFGSDEYNELPDMPGASVWSFKSFMEELKSNPDSKLWKPYYHIVVSNSPQQYDVVDDNESVFASPKVIARVNSKTGEVVIQDSLKDAKPEPIAEVEKPTVDDGKSIKAKDMETRLTAEAKLENMIEKKLIGSDNNRMVAEKLNRQIVELGGKDRANDFKKVEAPKVKKAETIVVKANDIETNNMGVMDSEGNSDVLYEGEGDRVFKTRQTKETLMNSEKIDDVMKDRVIADNPNLYETRPQRDVKMEVVSDIQRNGYDNTLKEIMAQNEEGSGFNTDYDQEMLASMMIETQRMRKKNKDNGYYQEQFDKLYKIYSESGTEVARGLAIRKELATTPIGKAIASKGEVEKHRTTEQKEIAGDIDKVVDGIFGDDNLVDAEKAAEAIQKKFKVPKKWIEQLRKDIVDENLTKTQVKERLAEQLKVPTLTEAEFDEIAEIADKLDKLDPKSETYEKEAKELTGKIREMVDRKNITFWQKVSSVQTMAMLMNVKTTLRNEIGNFLGFGTGQLDDVFSYVFDMPIKALTGKQGTLRPAINPKNYSWWKNTKKSFELLNDQTASDVDNKYQKKRVFTPGSKMGYLEGVLAVLLSDSRHKQSRIDMMTEQIKATEQYAKANGLDFDAEGFLAEMNYYADYNTFNFDSKMAQWLDTIVKETNLKMTPFISNKDFGTGTLLAKFAKTPMNIIQYQLDHIGADLLREGVRTSRLAKKYGMKNAIAMNQTKISRSLGKTATGMTYIMLGTLLSNAGAFIDEEEDKDVKALLQANGINGGYFNFSALRRSLSGGESKYQAGDSTVSINWMLPVAPFLLLGSRLSKAKSEQEADTILQGLQSAITAMGSSASDFAELPFNRTLGILTSPYYSGMDKFNQVLSGTVTGFVPSPVKQLAQGIDPTSKKYSKNTAVAFGQQIKATLPGLRNTVPNRFDITGETTRFTDNETMVGDIFEMFLNPAYTDTVSDDPVLSDILKAQESGNIHTLPKVSNDYFSYNSERYDMTPEEHQQYQKDYFEAYAKNYKTKKGGSYVDAHTLAAEQAKMNYMRNKKIKFEKTETGRLKYPSPKK